MGNSSVEIQIPDQLINDIVRAELVRALGDREQLLAAVVRSALAAKAKSYSSKTLFEEKVDEMIRHAATEAFAEWIGSNKSAIRDALHAELDRSKGKRIKEIVDSLISELSRWDIKAFVSLSQPD